MKSGSELCARHVFNSLQDLKTIMAFVDPVIVNSLESHIVNALTSLSYDYVIPLMSSQLDTTLNSYIASHLQEYTEKISVPGADIRECFKELMSGLSKQMGTAFEVEWKKDIHERSPKTNFNRMVQDMIKDIRKEANQATPQPTVPTTITPDMVTTLPSVPTTTVRVSTPVSPLINEPTAKVAVLAS